jgi:hypothetical protein
MYTPPPCSPPPLLSPPPSPNNRSLTENTRASYPIHYIKNAHIPCIGGHPRNIILLCCDAFGEWGRGGGDVAGVVGG